MLNFIIAFLCMNCLPSNLWLCFYWIFAWHFNSDNSLLCKFDIRNRSSCFVRVLIYLFCQDCSNFGQTHTFLHLGHPESIIFFLQLVHFSNIDHNPLFSFQNIRCENLNLDSFKPSKPYKTFQALSVPLNLSNRLVKLCNVKFIEYE